MNGTTVLKTDRLVLRRYCESDAAPLYKKFGADPEMYEYSGWNPYATEDMAAETVRKYINSYEDKCFYGWAIEHDGCLVGTVGAYDPDLETGTIEVGMSIERGSWGKGFATEALTCVLRYLTEKEGIRTVTAWCAADNIGSAKAMAKAGMVQTDTGKDALEINGRKFDKYIFEYSGDSGRS